MENISKISEKFFAWKNIMKGNQGTLWYEKSTAVVIQEKTLCLSATNHRALYQL